MERAKGFEPSTENLESPQNQQPSKPGNTGCTQIRAQIADSASRDLAKVVASWKNLPGPLKAAILAIVKSVEGIQ
jgi:hypothetical protein